MSTYSSDITAMVPHRQLAPWTLGRETEDLSILFDLVVESEHKLPGSYLRRAIGVLDAALWNLRDKRAGKPVVEMLGGAFRTATHSGQRQPLQAFNRRSRKSNGLAFSICFRSLSFRSTWLPSASAQSLQPWPHEPMAASSGAEFRYQNTEIHDALCIAEHENRQAD